MLFASNHTVEGQIATYLRVMAPFIPISAVYQTLDGAAQGFSTMVPSLVVEKVTRPFLTVALLVAVFATVGGERVWIGVGWATPWMLALVPTSLWVHHLLVREEQRHDADRPAAPG